MAKNYQAMVDAGLLAQRQRLTLAQIQENLQTVLGAEADTSAAMASLGLSAAIEGQEHQTVQLTTKKIQEAVATDVLTQAQAQEFAMRTGVILSMQRQAASVLPKWIATVKAATIAVLEQVKATALWIATNPVGWLTYVAAVIGGAVWVYKKFGDTVENAKEKVKDATEKFNEAASELENIETELSNIESKIKELEALDSLTWVEQEELNRLRDVTRELELQKQIKQEAQLQAAEDLFDSNKHLFEKEYRYFNLNNHDSNVRDIEERLNTGRISIAQVDFDNIDDAIGTLRFLQKEKEKLLTADSITEKLESQINEYDEFMEDIKHNFSETLSSLSEYKQNILEIASIRDLTQDEQDFYDYLSSMQKMIYEYYSPATWNNLEFDSIFDTKDIEKTKEELVSMYKSGELSSAEMLEQFPKLNEAIKQSEIIAGESSNVYKEFFNEIAALAEEQANVVNDVMEEAKVSLSINETVVQLNTRLKPTFDTLKSAYQDIFTSDGFDLDAVDIPMLEDIRSAIEKLNESEDLDFNIDMGAFDDFAKVLTDANTTEKEAQQAFDDLATSLFYATDATEGMSEETLKLVEQLLESLGVTNAEEVAMYALKDSKTQAVLATCDLADATRDSFIAILDEGEAANLTRQEIYSLTAAEIAFGQNTLSTEQKIQQLRELASAYGDTTSAALATAIANDLASGHTDVDSAINDLMAKINNGVQKVDIDFSSTGASSKKSGSSSSSKKDTTKEFDWIEQAIENVEKEVKNLDDVVNSAYSTFSQKNGALAQEIGKVSEEIDLQQQAYDEYMRKADSIGLPDYYKELVQNGTIGIEEITDENLQNQIDAYQKWYDKAQNAADAIKELKTDMKDLYVSAYELQTDNLKERLDSDSITRKQYLDGLKAAYEQFYANLEDFAQQYHEAVLEYLDEEKSYLNDVAGAAASLLDKEIDNIRDDADDQENRLKKQIDLLKDRKKPLEDELKALEDKAKKENLIYNLQKAQYDLARAEYQRPKLVYSEEKGLHYTNDPQAIRDAKKDVDDAKLEIQKQSIQDQIDALDDEIDRYNDLIDQINKAADDQIDALEKIKNKWQEVIDQQEYAKNVSLLTGEFGTSAITKILTGNDDDLLAQWKNNYINTLAGIDMESQGYIGNMTKQIASLYGVDLSPLQSQFMGVKDSVDGMTDALGQAANALGIGNVANNTENPATPEGTTAPPTNTEPSLESAIKNETETAMDAFDQHTDKLTNEVIPAIQAATEEMNAFNESADMDIEKTITIHYETTGEKPSDGGNIAVGKAHVEGTAKVSGDWSVQSDEKKALVGEVGRELIVRNGKFFTVGENGAEMFDIKKGDIVFNHEQTEELLKNGYISGHGKAYADGTVGGGKFLSSDGHILRSLQPGDPGWDFLQKCQPLVDKILSGQMDIVSNAVFDHQKQMEKIVKEITNNTAINNLSNTRNIQPSVNIGDIHVTCPGVTDQQVANRLGNVIEKKLNEKFSGLRNYVDQQSRIR
ncbi:MAG: hypothetical protein K2N44_05405 [Lachnospiraceae bacterium]|nr:hypothetical protein [Lachnospiraceae bacterium]